MMKLPRRQFLQLAAGAAAFPTVSRIASAQAFPSRPITIVVPTGAGGPSDVIARIIAERMRASLGQPVIIENVAGANGTIGIGRVARAKPDGYTLAFSVSFSTHVVHGAIHKLPYDVIDDFEPVALVTDSPQVILAKKAMPANDLKRIDRVAQGKPRQGLAGTDRPGQSGACGRHPVPEADRHPLPVRELSQRRPGHAGHDRRTHRPDVRRPNIALEHVRAGSIKAYAVTDKSRLAAAPDIPTVDEAGLPGFYAAPWHAFWAPKGTPREVIAKLNAAVVDALADTAVRKRLNDVGLQIVPREQQTPEALGAFQKAEIERWWPILKEAGIKVE